METAASSLLEPLFPGVRRLASALVALAVAGALVAVAGTPARAVAGQYLEGIDVSHHNSDPPKGPINWKAVKSAGIKFAFAKASEGVSFVDPAFATNRSGAAAANLAFGGYHYARPSGSTAAQINADGKAEADHFIDVVSPKPGDLLPVLDLESRTDGLTVAQRKAWVWAFLNEVVARIHEKPIIYSGYSFWQTYMGDTTEYADAGFRLLWAPNWYVSTPKIPAQNWGGYGWTFWQYTDRGTVAGVTGGVDRDKFKGTDLTAVEVGSPPSNVQPPTARGTAEETSVLTASSGQWSGTAPFTYTYRWRRCDSGGGDCAYIPQATARTYTLTGGDVNALVSVEVTATNRLGSAVSESGQTPPVAPYDVTPPSVPVFTQPAYRYTTTTTVPVAWSSTDDKSGVGSYGVRYRVASATADFGPLTTLFASTPDTSTTLSATPGRTYCLSARATDRWKNISDWSGERCTTVPFDDRAMTPSSGWARQNAAAFYRGSALSTSTRWATLTRERLEAVRIRVLAETCPTCGQIRVRWNDRVVGTFDLVSPTTLHRRLLPEIVLPGVETGTLQIRVITAKRPVVIDGVAATRL